ncbi:hypothetical protein D9O40_02475 [Clostridium autoethanogenum]|uniref:Uncharacterized protein n=1 Tax=Clostridium autoethanogenum TaxID=84023 RepID=A0A3M0T319_9CLOT|nr:hypothetical protein [Clostridium autoethanogenum]RMD04332.1 hypothetical protein D9O40_02475 [Clostridium autoethanogenum]
MPNVYDGIRKMDDEELKYLIASLETVTITNIASEMGQKAKRRAVKFANTIKGLFDSKQFSVPKVIPLDKRIALRKAEFDNIPREKLNSKIKSILVEKVNAAGEKVSNYDSEDEISVNIISTAVKNYKKEISENLTPAQKADAIRHRYNEKLMAQNRDQLKNQTEDQREQTEQAIQNQINNMSEKEQKELKDALGVDNLTGSAIRKMLTTAAGTTVAMTVLDASGFGAYVALTTIMHAIFTTTIGITLPFAAYTGATSFLAFITGPVGWAALIGVEALMINHNKDKLIYELLSQVVWRSVESYGYRFTPREEELPSWLPDIERDAAIAESTAYMDLLRENEKLKEEHTELKNNISNNEDIISQNSSTIKLLNQRIKEANGRTKENAREKQELEQKYLNANSKFQKIKNEIESMHQKYENLSEEDKSRYEFAKSDAEKYKDKLDKKEKEIADLYQLIDDSMKKGDEKKALIESLNDKVKRLKDKNALLVNKLDKNNQDVERKTESKRKKLESRWGIAYKRFTFDTGVIKYVVKNFPYNELGNIEAVLMEIHQTDDPMALTGNRGKIYDGRAHIEFSTSSGFPGRIFYRIDKNQPNGKSVIITNILKHNDSRYCK